MARSFTRSDRTPAAIVSLLLVLPLMIPGIARAQLGPDQVGIYFDQTGTTRALDGALLEWTSDGATPYTDQSVYLLARDLPEGVKRAEFTLGMTPQRTKLGEATFPQQTTATLSEPSTCTCISFAIDAGSACVATSGTVVLGKFEIRFWQGGDVQVWLSAAIPSSLDPPAPGYIDCTIQRAAGWQPFVVANDTVEITLGAPAGQRGWGTLKAAYTPAP